MADDLDRRVEKLEVNQEPEGPEDAIIINVVEDGTRVDPDTGERHRFHRTPTGWEEGKWEDWGGTQVRVRHARYDAEHGIVRDPAVTGD